MDVSRISQYFVTRGFAVDVIKFHDLDLHNDFSGVYILYQTSEAKGSFYKRYIEDLVFHLERRGAITLPCFEYLKAHHNKIFMEFLRENFIENSLKSLKSRCFGSWEDALYYNPVFPVVIKKASGSGGAGVFLARDASEYKRYLKEAGKVVIADSITGIIADKFKNLARNTIKAFYPDRSGYVEYDTTPVSNPVIVQSFVEGLKGDYKVLFFGGKYYAMYRKNRDNDFRASGSGRFFEVPGEQQEGLLGFAAKVTSEINFPVIGMDIGYDGVSYHLIEFQMIHPGTSALQRSKYWHEYKDGKWIRMNGISDLEEEFSRSVFEKISMSN
jgi:glutathione synthase/RimK-type ligase-like ATP-grasp enzyme